MATIYNVSLPCSVENDDGFTLSNKLVKNLNKIENFSFEVNLLKEKSHIFDNISVDDLLTFFDSLAINWLEKEQTFVKGFSNFGISFFLSFLRRSNIELLLKESLHGNIFYLDNFFKSKELGKKIMCHPRGIITHWLSGNVPFLGLISLTQGIITKNVNILKLPRQNGYIIPMILSKVFEHSIKTKSGTELTGEDLLNTVLLVYCEKDDNNAHKLLSDYSNVRVAWGGQEAVQSILSIPRKYGTEDVIFGPKYSFVVVGKNSYPISVIDEISFKIAMDASVFNQYGCNSPHTVFVEKGGEVSPLIFAEKLAAGMEKALKRIPKLGVSAEEATKVVTIRTEYLFKGKVFKSNGTDWTVIYSEESGIAPPSFSRIVFVRPVESVYDIIKYVNHGMQTVGLLIDENRKEDFAKKITACGIERITDIGKMSMYDHPWDGIFPLDRFVRWVSLE